MYQARGITNTGLVWMLLLSFSLTIFCSRNRNPEVLIKKYFQQLTSGCGRDSCHNIHCVSGGRTALSCDEAAAMALRLLLEKAQLCPDETGS